MILNYSYHSLGDELIEIQQEYLENIPNDSEKIFIIGNSRTLAIDPERVQKTIEGSGYEVYNISIGGTGFIERSKVLNLIIDSHPKIIVLGLSGDDFSDDIRKINIKNEQNNHFQFFSLITEDFPFLASPRYYFVNLFTSNFNEISKIKGEQLDSKLPFFIKSDSDYDVIPNHKLKLENDRVIPQVIPLERNSKLKIIEDFIDTLIKNDIHVVVITNPFSRIWIDNTTIGNKENFNEILNYFAESKNIQVVNLTEKYADMEIWRDPQHIAFGEPSNVYTDDVVKIIKKML